MRKFQLFLEVFFMLISNLKISLLYVHGFRKIEIIQVVKFTEKSIFMVYFL